jgi:hypothetical protein
MAGASTFPSGDMRLPLTTPFRPSLEVAPSPADAHPSVGLAIFDIAEDRLV